MKPIQMVDLQSQYKRLKSEIDAGIADVIESAAFINGPHVKQFEKELADYTGARHIIACANGTDALQIAMMALDLPEGSEVITPGFSYAALAEVILLLKLKPVFVEVDPANYMVVPSAIEQAITPKTKVIAPVHLYGQCADMEAIMDIAEKHKLYVIEDTAQAIGSVYTFKDGTQKQAGTMGHIGTTSFFPSKNLGCYGDGGAIYCNDDDLALAIRMVANHGQKVKYEHLVVGVNSRLDTLQAAILSAKLKHLKQFEDARNHVANYYDKALEGIATLNTPKRESNSTHVFHQYTMQLQDEETRDGLKKYLAENGIPSMVYYPFPLHRQHAYAQNISLPVCEKLCKLVLSLPISTEMEESQLAYIAGHVKQYLNK